MFSESSPCLLGQHGSCNIDQRPGELSENILQNLFHKLLPQTVGMYRVNWCMVVDLFCYDFVLDVLLFCPAQQPILSNSHLPKQNRAGGKMTRIKFNTTQDHNQQVHPVNR